MSEKTPIYIFTFYNEFCEEIENTLSDIIQPEEDMKRTYVGSENGKGEEIVSVMFRKGMGITILTAYPDISYVYRITIFIKEKKKEEILELLQKIKENIYEDYGEDHSKELKERTVDEIQDIIRIGNKYGFGNMIKEFVDLNEI